MQAALFGLKPKSHGARLPAMRLRLVICFLMPLGAWCGDAGKPVWEGYMAWGADVRIMLSERETKRSAWVEVGGSFAGFTLEKFNHERERGYLPAVFRQPRWRRAE